MSRRASFLVAVAALSSGVLAVGLLALLQPDPAAQHNPGHANCPPGSHGRGWSADHAKSFNVPRRQGWGRGEAARLESGLDLSERALTAGRPR